MMFFRVDVLTQFWFNQPGGASTNMPGSLTFTGHLELRLELPLMILVSIGRSRFIIISGSHDELRCALTQLVVVF